ncbi:FadR/GntR family transcriptional regulator [Amnibacterium flavum]|nr:FCD domain-containing protein [Amnibacterium flavum]
MATERAWELVLARIESDLLNGTLKIGDHLPPERTLAAELDVGRSSVREAVRVLEVLGLVRIGTGSGPTAGAVVVSRPGGGMSALMRLQVAGRGFAVDDVVRTRVLLESSVAAELASAVQDLTDAHSLLEVMDRASPPEEFLALDAQFHYLLAEMSGNTVVAAVMAGLRGSIEGYVVDGARGFADWPAVASRLQGEHRGLLAAIEAGDAAGASALVAEHIRSYYRDSNLSVGSLDQSSARSRADVSRSHPNQHQR